MLHSQERSLIELPRGRAQADLPHDRGTDVAVEPVPRLEWSLATESHPSVSEGTTPGSLRRSWIHTAPERQVLGLFRKLHGARRGLPAPWWLRALDRGEIESREAAFAFEDEVHAMLSNRPGWVFVPWCGAGESGYWEYAPSDRAPVSEPTAVVLTDEHLGWLNVVPAHADDEPLPVPAHRVDGLLSILEQVETW
ncbi:hypothetical protein GCM10009854_08630 [Saccharopolyspora halophila]|uniref:SMI1/KNR4 family protein n=1 Tax=Saccharopolyspora halophila TaxID=405551 RepID=A0ABP5SN25_9PSEU